MSTRFGHSSNPSADSVTLYTLFTQGAYQVLDYKLKLIYGDIIGPGPTDVYCNTITHTALLTLYVQHSIACTQCDSTTLVFESAKDRMFAQLALSDKSYSTQCID